MLGKASRPAFVERPYQVAANDASFARLDGGDRSTLVVLPTGTGKTVLSGMACRRVKEVARNGGRSLFVAHRTHLVRQAARTLKGMGMRVTIDSGMHRPARVGYDVCVATVQSLTGDRIEEYARDHFDFIVTDECHHSLAESHMNVYRYFEKSKHLGITATPMRGDRQKLGRVYDSKAYTYRVTQAIADGWLVPVREYRVPVKIDLRGINTHSKEHKGYSSGDVSERIGPRIEEICRAALRELGDRQAVFFTPCVPSAFATADCLRKLGVTAAAVAGAGGKSGMKRKDSDAVLAAYERFEVQCVVCCDLLEEGWDVPATSAVVQMRPSPSPFRYIQRVGRGTRLCPEIGKEDCLVLDFDWVSDDTDLDLCSSVDIYDDGEIPLDPWVRKEAARRVRAGETDVRKAIEEAEEAFLTRPNFEVILTGRRPQFEMVPKTAKDSGEILGVKLSYFDLNPQKGGGPASPAQIGLLKHHGIAGAERLGKWGASKMISEVMRREKLDLAGLDQVRRLLALGLAESCARTMSRADAFKYLAAHDMEAVTCRS